MPASRYVSAPDRQGSILKTVSTLVMQAQVIPIATTQLNELSAETMKIAHELVETRRTIGKVVIAI
jgi:NADPH:quinone reductase